jgi:adenine-specific DNA-methyltransferase
VSDSLFDVEKLRREDYLSRQIIPYIGNKRKLLPLIHRAMEQVFPHGFSDKTFLDPFAGSGIVSRFAKYLGFEVFSNDWELYSYLSCYAFLKINLTDLGDMFAAWGGLDGMLDHLNSLPPPPSEREFIARYYSPRDDALADYRKERLFYTRENGLIIDKIRNEIERIYPFTIRPDFERGASVQSSGADDAVATAPIAAPIDGANDCKEDEQAAYSEKALLLALLIHGAATHTNTSGVFKAYHKGFGGFSRDALSRILKPIFLLRPPLWDSHRPQHVCMMNAAVLLEHLGDREFDIAYLDPPYNQHQYGSNYHLLNTIALWDRVSPGDRETGGKAGIRKDWVLTRSDYCYRDSAVYAFTALLKKLKARYIFISYSTEGIISFDVLMKLCAEKGKVELFTDEYVKYRGGRQSIHRLNHNVEFVIIIDTARRTVQSDFEEINEQLTGRRLNLQTKRRYVKELLEESFTMDEKGEAVGFVVEGRTVWIETQGFFALKENDLCRLIDRCAFPVNKRREAKERLLDALQRCQCRDRVEELQQLLMLLREHREDGAPFAAAVPGLLRKLAHKKYKQVFMESLETVRVLQWDYPQLFSRIAGKIDEVEELAQKRFRG